MESNLILATKLKMYRKKQGMTQEELAKKAGVTVRGYGKLERCEVNTRLSTVDKLADALGITTSELLKDV